MIEGVDVIEELLVVVDLEVLMDYCFQFERGAVNFRGLDGVLDFAKGTEQAASVDAHSFGRFH